MEINFNSNKIMPMLWFNGKAEEAVNFYVNLFPKSAVEKFSYWGEGAGYPPKWVSNVGFNLCGLNMYAMDAGEHHSFNDAISFFVHCKDQAEVDKYHAAITLEGKESMCGWVIDKYGVRWQLVPMQFIQMMGDADKIKVGKMIKKMLTMKKLVVLELEEAFNG